ncbi:MAG: NAD(P)H-quinone oxidoreductase [Pseudomonadota bacterium]
MKTPPSLPKTMQVIALTEPGGPDKLQAEDRPVPKPKAGQILIETAAAGVNRPDVLQRQGLYKPPAGASDVLGLEVAGHVVALGEGVNQWQIGDRVCALCHGGAYATFVAVDARHVLPVPDTMKLDDAACLPEALFTVWANLFDDGGLQPDQTTLIHGGSSGIGTIAIQMAKLIGAKTIVTVGHDDKAMLCGNLGAVHAINYNQQDFVEEIDAITDGLGVHVVLDMVGGAYVNRNLRCLRPHGRHVSIAFQDGHKAEIDLRLIMGRRLRLTGSLLRPRSADEKAEICTEIAQNIWPAVIDGKIKPVIFERFTLAEAAAAHKVMDSGEMHGKLLLINRLEHRDEAP